MKEHCKSPRHQEAAGQAQDRRLSRPQGVTIESPPKEDGPERLYRVVYVIDVCARNPQQAAKHAYEIMRDPESMRPALGKRTAKYTSEAVKNIARSVPPQSGNAIINTAPILPTS